MVVRVIYEIPLTVIVTENGFRFRFSALVTASYGRDCPDEVSADITPDKEQNIVPSRRLTTAVYEYLCCPGVARRLEDDEILELVVISDGNEGMRLSPVATASREIGDV